MNSGIPTIEVGVLVDWLDSVPIASKCPSCVKEVADKIGDCLVNVGFFNAIGHGVEVVNLLEDSAKFFLLPESIKKEISISHSPCWRGYSEIGSEQTGGKRDIREQLDFGVHNNLKPELKLYGPNQYPDGRFKASLDSYFKQCTRLGRAILCAIAIYLGHDYCFFEDSFLIDPSHLCRALHYPRCTEESMIQGTGEHTDFGCLAILWQSSSGLEVKSGNSDIWLSVPLDTDAMVINIGYIYPSLTCGSNFFSDMLEVWTGGVMKATPHRVIRSVGEPERFSFPFFYEPNLDAVIAPLIPNEAYPPIKYGDHMLAAWMRSFPNMNTPDSD